MDHRKFIRRAISALTAAAVFLPCGGCQKGEGDTVSDTLLTVTFLDVGKADAIILHSDNSTVLIDCGEKGDGKDILARLEEQDITAVDYMIITHFDKDHVGGAAKVINNIEVRNVLTPDYEKESEEMDKFLNALNNTGTPQQKLTEDISFTLDNISYTVYAPLLTDYGKNDENDFSLVTRAVCGENTLLFTGDAMEQRLAEIMDIGECTLLKVPYHGRKIDNLSEFLDAVKPKCAVVCTSVEDIASSVWELLSSKGIASYATCYNGTITAECDGKNISITKEK